MLESDTSRELYTPGLALPVEPTVPMRFRVQLIALVSIVVFALLAFVAFRLVTAGQDFDPSLDGQVEDFDPTIPVIPGEG